MVIISSVGSAKFEVFVKRRRLCRRRRRLGSLSCLFSCLFVCLFGGAGGLHLAQLASVCLDEHLAARKKASPAQPSPEPQTQANKQTKNIYLQWDTRGL